MLACYWEQLGAVEASAHATAAATKFPGTGLSDCVCLQLLLRHGADADATSNNGARCLDFPPRGSRARLRAA